ncbi:hypothetical protein EUX98_g7976 [Antrodiella citrinella]|uniref:Reverse transcriptase Ty1/copia-type domain-containing protein n=1 Tax=Antrodiella citrinella TaxID=2447956 RepID=A0A4S4MJ37_9APHY|nr:hypothetical protein EUX98_g7976 [Antrodiella citrinella]
MIYLGVAEGIKGFKFMCQPNNVIFTAITAVFDEEMFPRCPDQRRRNTTRIGQDNQPADTPLDIPPEVDANDDDDAPAPRPHHTHHLSQRDEGRDHDGDHDGAAAPNPPPPPPPPEEPPAPQPRHSGRERRPVNRPGNVYGERRNPVDQFKDVECMGKWKEIVGEQPSSSRNAPQLIQDKVPRPNLDHPNPSRDNAASSEVEVKDILARLCREGGVELIDLLLAKAIPQRELLPDESNVREWTFRDISKLPEKEQEEWRHACREELEALHKRKVFELVNLPEGRKVIRNRWVFNVKSDGRKKARLVAKGFSQVEGVDFDQIFSPVVRFETVHLVLALAALEDWHVSGVHVKSAYLYGKLEEEIYMEQPEGFKVKGQERKVLRLLRALYGLKQADKKTGDIVLVVVYVDDALFCGKNKALVAKLKADFMKRWECRDLGDTKEFLRMRIRRDVGKIFIDQVPYLNKTVIGSLLYIMLGTRPDIAYAVTTMSRFALNPSPDHLNKVLYICRYLLGTKDYALVYDDLFYKSQASLTYTSQVSGAAHARLLQHKTVVALLCEDMRALNSLTTVSRLWKEDVQEVIFQGITLSFTQRRSAHDFITACVGSIRRDRHTAFSANIHTLTVLGSHFPLTREYSNHEIHQPNLSVNDICTVVTFCRNLENLQIGYCVVDDLDVNAFFPGWHHCKSRSIKVHLNRCHFTSSALYTLLKFTRVRELIMFGINVEAPLENIQPDMLAHTYKLSLSRVNVAERPVTEAHQFGQEDWVSKMYKVASPRTLTALTVQCSLKSVVEMWQLKMMLPIMGANLRELWIDFFQTDVESVKADMIREQWIEEDTVFPECRVPMQLKKMCQSLHSLTLSLSIDQEQPHPADTVGTLSGERRVVEDTNTFVMWIFALRLLEAAPPTLMSITISLCSHGEFNFRYVLPMDTTLRMVPWDR